MSNHTVPFWPCIHTAPFWLCGSVVLHPPFVQLWDSILGEGMAVNTGVICLQSSM